MTHGALEFLADYDFAPAIVWDALTDDVLVEGWLAAASIDARVGGEYLLRWQTGTGLAPASGVISELVPRRRLAIDTDNIGRLEFSLHGLGGRGEATRLRARLLVDTDPRLLATTNAYWRCNLDQLGELLRGHPVDWTTWQSDYGPRWERYRDEAASARAGGRR